MNHLEVAFAVAIMRTAELDAIPGDQGEVWSGDTQTEPELHPVTAAMYAAWKRLEQETVNINNRDAQLQRVVRHAALARESEICFSRSFFRAKRATWRSS